jgi:hypothetical protein
MVSSVWIAAATPSTPVPARRRPNSPGVTNCSNEQWPYGTIARTSHRR